MRTVLDHGIPFERYFEEISAVPHGSKNEKAIADYLVSFANAHGLWVWRDELHNVIIKKEGTGAALGLIPRLVAAGQATCRDVAVFVAMCMCWSGYLSTHVSMMDVLRCSRFTGRAILSHTVGGLVAGMAANWLFQLFALLG